MRFTFLTGDINWQTYGGSFVSKKLNNGEFDYWLVLRVENWNEHDRNPQNTYNVSLLSVSPAEAGSDNLKSAMSCCGIEPDTDMAQRVLGDSLCQVDTLVSYGVYATLWSADGNNLSKLMREAHKQADQSQILYGFMMDRNQNRIGNDGWDFQRGQIGFKSAVQS